MQILVYGAGYLGTVLSACLADFGTPIVCCDSAEDKRMNLAQGRIAFYEKNLEELIRAELFAHSGIFFPQGAARQEIKR
jgi:UDPglucose 6-dehydrogenase